MHFLARAALITSLAVPALLAGVVATAQQPPSALRVGVVDIQRAMETTEDGMRATANLKKMFDSKQQELSRREQELMRQREELDKKARVMSQAAVQKEMEAWQKATLELQSTYVEYNKELQKKRVEMLYPVQDKILRAIQRLANDASDPFAIIIDKATVAYVRSDLDLTDRAIQLANAGVGAAPAGSARPPAAGSGAPALPPAGGGLRQP